jgi:transcriptional regulator with XRE-family HTH domain
VSAIKRFQNRVVATAFGRVMKDARSQRDMTHESLAERADLHETYPSLLERGLRNPGLPIVIAIGEALGVGGDVRSAKLSSCFDANNRRDKPYRREDRVHHHPPLESLEGLPADSRKRHQRLYFLR